MALKRGGSVARILVVDDEPAILELLKRLLERNGHEVLVAQNADAAVAILRTSNPEIAIVDLVMPGKGGLTLIMENLASKPDLMVVAMSGRIPLGTDSVLGLGNAIGVSCYLPKPFTPEELEQAISTALSKRCA